MGVCPWEIGLVIYLFRHALIIAFLLGMGAGALLMWAAV